jgi:hypothetical protein
MGELSGLSGGGGGMEEYQLLATEGKRVGGKKMGPESW